jgi:hypothetical protein
MKAAKSLACFQLCGSLLAASAETPADRIEALQDFQDARQSGAPSPAILSVSVDRPMPPMAGGIGASWHAIRVMTRSNSATLYQYDARPDNPQGSAVGANPPLDSKAWKDIDRLGRWLGLAWIGCVSSWIGGWMNRICTNFKPVRRFAGGL